MVAHETDWLEETKCLVFVSSVEIGENQYFLNINR